MMKWVVSLVCKLNKLGKNQIISIPYSNVEVTTITRTYLKSYKIFNVCFIMDCSIDRVNLTILVGYKTLH